jgi:hypothetical protein
LRFASSRTAFVISFTGTTDPSRFDVAVNATMRVLSLMSGSSSSTLSAKEYGLFGFVGEECQYLITAPVRAASFFHGPAFAEHTTQSAQESSPKI